MARRKASPTGSEPIEVTLDDGGEPSPIVDDGGLVSIEPTALDAIGSEDRSESDSGIVAHGNTAEFRKKRGRKPGTKNPSKTSAPVSVTGLEKILIGIHAGLAKVLREPSFALDKKEADELARGVADVAQHYNMGVDPKTGAWINLIVILFAMYAPRVALVFTKAKQKQREERIVQTHPDNEQTPLAPTMFDPTLLTPIGRMN